MDGFEGDTMNRNIIKMNPPKICDECNNVYETGHSQKNPEVIICGCACGFAFFDKKIGEWLKL
jgi:hypothetical protein